MESGTVATRRYRKKKKASGHNASTFLHWAALRLFHLHHSKGQSMEEGPFVRNCQQRQGPQA